MSRRYHERKNRIPREGRQVIHPCHIPGCILSHHHELWGIGCVFETETGYVVQRPKEKK